MTQSTCKTMLLAALMALASCAKDEEQESFNQESFNQEQNGSYTTTDVTTELSKLDVAIDSTAMSETLDTYDASDEYAEDYVEDFTTSATIRIAYNGTSDATVSGTADGVEWTVNGGHVTVYATVKNVAYELSGSTSNGQFKIYSSYKFKLTLNGVNITNTTGAAINNQGKRMYLVLADGTTNTLTDGSSYTTPEDEDEKGTLFSEGKLPISGAGKLRVYSRCKHGIVSDDYILVRPQTNLYVQSLTGHAIKSNDGVIVRGGVVNAEASAAGCKAIKTDGLVSISGGRTTLIATGGVDTSESDYTGAAALKSDSIVVVTGGTLYCKATGQGGKAISTDQTMSVSGGTIHAVATGNNYGSSSSYRNSSSDNSVAAKAIKVDGALSVSGGVVLARSASHEGIETKSTLNITGGQVASYSSDDAINSASHTTISGGYVFACATGNDGLDANGNLYIQGGTVYAVGSSSPEVAIDANTEDGYKLYLTGGNVIAIGGLEQGSSLSQTCYQTNSWSCGTWYALQSDGTSTLAFQTPSTSQLNSTLVVSTSGTASLLSGVSVSGGTTLFGGMANTGGDYSGGSSVTLSSYTGGNSGGGPGGQMGGGPGRR